MRSLLIDNLKLTLPTVLATAGLGYLLSLPGSFLFDGKAARWQFGLERQGGIETQRLINLGRFHLRGALVGAIGGLVIAQTTFVVFKCRERP